MRITRIELHDIGPFADAVLEFPESTGKGEVVLFEGPNGCGKTTIAETIAVLIGRWIDNDLKSMLGDPVLQFPAKRLGERLRGSNWSASLTLDDETRKTKLAIQKNLIEPFVVSTLPGVEPIPAPRLEDRSIPVSWAPFAFKGHSPSAKVACEGPRVIREDPIEGALSFGQNRPRKLLANFSSIRNTSASKANCTRRKRVLRKMSARTNEWQTYEPIASSAFNTHSPIYLIAV